MRYGFIGLGNLGGKLASSLARNGFNLVVNDADPKWAEPLLAAGARWRRPRSGRGASRRRHHLPALPRGLRARAYRPRGRVAGAKPGATWIEMSTIDQDTILRLAAVAAERGVATLETPVTGGVHLAATGEITVIVGGDAELFERHRAAFAAMGRRIFTSARSARPR